MYCSRCGATYVAGDRFCAACGAPISARSRRRWLLVAALAVGTIPLLIGSVLFVPGLLERYGPSGFFTASDGSAPPSHSAETSARTSEIPTRSSEPVGQPDFPGLFAELSSGVVPVYAVVCDGVGVGSGFLIDRDTVVTAAHVIDGAVAVSVQVDGTPHTATVAGIDESADVAVLDLHSAAAGHALRFAQDDPERGDPVAALGYPNGDPLGLSEGTVVDVGESVLVEDKLRDGVVVSDVSVDHGNSGGPLIDDQGDVVGVMIAGQEPPDGRSIAVQVSVVEPMVTDPAGMGSPGPGQCEQPLLGPDDQAVAGLPSEEDVGEEIAWTLANYFTGINTGDYRLAYDQFSPRLRGPSTYEAFAHGVSTSYDFGFEVRDAHLDSERPHVTLEFVSLQDPQFGPDGEGCTVWLLEYEFVRGDHGRYLIDEVNPPDGAAAHTPCR